MTPLHDNDIANEADVLAAFAKSLRLHTADGDASPATIRTYHSQAAQFVEWCREQDIDPAAVTEDHVIRYRKDLIDAGYSRSSIALKLSVVRRLYEAIRWRGIRQDNPAAGIKAPKDRTSRNERVKYLPLDGLRRLLVAPEGNGVQATRDRAMLILMAVHGLHVAEVSDLRLANVDLGASMITVVGKGRKARKVYLTEQTSSVLCAWLNLRGDVALPESQTVFVVVGNRATGTPISDRSIRFLVDGYLEAVGLKAEGISCHALRHSAATWARAGGAKLDAIADMLGHSSTTTTQVYAQIVDRMSENPARYLEAVMRLP
jgi:integrase/recombinase XerC/integrase/recombinase XerD